MKVTIRTTIDQQKGPGNCKRREVVGRYASNIANSKRTPQKDTEAVRVVVDPRAEDAGEHWRVDPSDFALPFGKED
jgi:hypothetical protein